MRKSNYQLAKEYADSKANELYPIERDRFGHFYKVCHNQHLTKKLKELEDRKYTLEEMNKAFRLGIATEAFGLSNKEYEEFIKTLD